jgi:hypothetical protein
MFRIGWMDLSDDNARDLELNLNYRWQLWRVELFGFGAGFKIRQAGPRFEPEVKPKAKTRKK